jgi:hypothetical protein
VPGRSAGFTLYNAGQLDIQRKEKVMNLRMHKPVVRKLSCIGGLAAVFVAGMVAASGPAVASTRITEGTARASLQAAETGGNVVQQHNSVVKAGPGNFAGDIRPFYPDGLHYCSLDWHTIVLADLELGPESQAQAIISQLTVMMWVDGRQLNLTQTAVKRFTDSQVIFGVPSVFWSQWGQVMSPSSLTIGPHSLRAVMTGAGEDNEFTTTFIVDPANSGACL